ncbi:MAG: hypothetical protein IJP54_08865 [Synergistaceae bacterium]|nr:hypothetical protein [Synergistaceae bacterium]MBR0035775.1 hypothetical protein [Synergistaceae bacterium]
MEFFLEFPELPKDPDEDVKNGLDVLKDLKDQIFPESPKRPPYVNDI